MKTTTIRIDLTKAIGREYEMLWRLFAEVALKNQKTFTKWKNTFLPSLAKHYWLISYP
jgi:hypothetical protein